MARNFRFGEVEVRPDERLLLVSGRQAAVGARAFDVLMALVERRDRVVSKDELLRVVWPHAIVEENNLQAQISALRKAIGPRAFATIPGRGYQLTLALDEEAETSSPPPGNLPRTHGALFGREQALAGVVELMRSHRLVTLTGPGGVGKTRLAHAAAHASAGAHRHGAWWVDLAAVRAGESVAGAIARALGLPLGTAHTVQALAMSLGKRELLVLLDNCEHLVGDAAETASGILEAAPNVRLLATSQLRLGIPDEHVYCVEGLAIPGIDASIEQARSYGAVQLLEERMRALDQRLSLDDSNLATAIELCRHLDGNALAIEMAAGRIPALGLHVLAARLAERFRFLTRGPGSGDRHGSLRAMLEWSYALLDPREAALLRRLSVFAGAFTLETAEAMAGSPADAVENLTGLVGKSMLQRQDGEPTRYRLLETTRIYASEALAASGDATGARRQHGETMLALAERAIATFWTVPRPAWRASFDPDYPDLDRAFGSACEREDVAVAAATAQALTYLDMARNDSSMIRPRKHAAHALLPQADGLAKGRLLNAITYFRMVYEPWIPRLAMSRQRVDAWRVVGDPIEIYLAMAMLSADLASTGHFAAAERAADEARALEQASWPPSVRLWLARHARTASMYQGDAPRYSRQAAEVLALAQRAGNPSAVGFAHLLVAEAATMRGDYAEAISTARAARDDLRALDQPFNVAIASYILLGAFTLSGDQAAARECALEALQPMLHFGLGNWVFDYLSLVAARRDMPHHTAQMLGIADAGYEANQDSRQANERRAAQEAESLLAEVLPKEVVAGLRSAGAKLGEEEATRLALEVIR